MSKLLAGRTFDCEYEGEVFSLRVLSGELQDRLSAITKAPTPDARDEAFGMCVAKWPWEGSLRSVLSDRDCWALVAKAIEGTSLTADERKKFVSQPTLPAEESASTSLAAT